MVILISVWYFPWTYLALNVPKNSCVLRITIIDNGQGMCKACVAARGFETERPEAG